MAVAAVCDRRTAPIERRYNLTGFVLLSHSLRASEEFARIGKTNTRKEIKIIVLGN